MMTAGRPFSTSGPRMPTSLSTLILLWPGMAAIGSTASVLSVTKTG